MFVYCLFLVVMFLMGLGTGWLARWYYWQYIAAPTPAYVFAPKNEIRRTTNLDSQYRISGLRYRDHRFAATERMQAVHGGVWIT